MTINFTSNKVAVIGYGITGKACVEFLSKQNKSVSVFDSNFESYQFSPESIETAQSVKPFDESTQFTGFDFVVVSPGVDSKHPAIKSASIEGTLFISEIELFAHFNKAVVVAVTGSNGKSTVVDMLHQALVASGLKVGLGGNIGTSAITLVDKGYEVIVLEISSFQLELTTTFAPDVACILNITEDHIDRHGDFDTYVKIKHRIYHYAKSIVFNRDDISTYPTESVSNASFGMSAKVSSADTYIDAKGLHRGEELIIPEQRLRNISLHNQLNMQSVIQAGFPLIDKDQRQSFIHSLLGYTGLPHRYQKVLSIMNMHQQEITFIDDSKATNPGATIAAIGNVPATNLLVLIVGGDSKKADTAGLDSLIFQRVDRLLCIGKDAQLFMQMAKNAKVYSGLKECVDDAYQFVKNSVKPVTVLLSPACASIDMFDNYRHRGECFKQAVMQGSS